MYDDSKKTKQKAIIQVLLVVGYYKKVWKQKITSEMNEYEAWQWNTGLDDHTAISTFQFTCTTVQFGGGDIR